VSKIYPDGAPCTDSASHFPSADTVVCIDACFTQKHNKTKGKGGHRDPPNHHPFSIFMPEADVKAVEDFIASCRSGHPPSCGSRHQAHHAQNSSAGDDGYEAGMHVPTSVLNGCNDSFVAADEKREKASTQFFADTGLVALLCHHDRPL
jgi:hypothetical protein